MNAGRVVLFVGSDGARASELRASEQWCLEHVGTAAEARGTLGDVDCLVTEQSLPDGTGIDLCRTVRTRYPDVSLVLVPQTGSDELARDAVGADVDEYVPASTISDPGEICDVVARAIDSVDVQRRRYRKLVEQTTDVITVVDPDGTIQYVSPTIEEIIGYTQAELVGEDALTYVHPDDRDAVRTALEQRVRTDEETIGQEFRVERTDGSIGWVEARSWNFVDDPAIGGIVISSRDITDRKTRERERARNEAVIEAVDDLVFALDADGKFVFANGAHESMTGLSADDLVGTDPSAFMTAEAVERAESIIGDLLADESRTNATFEMDILDQDGTRVPCETHIALLTDDDGTFRGTAGIIRDISDRKEREELYSTLVREANDGILITKDGEIEFSNEQLASLLDGDRETIEGQPVLEFIAPSDRELVAADYRSRLEGDETTSRYEIDVETLSGDRIPVEVSTSLVSYQGGVGELAVIRDITERKERERELELYETMLNAVPDMVYALDDSGHFIAVNETFEDETKLSGEEILGEHVSLGMNDGDVQTGRERIRELLHDDEREKAIYEMEYWAADGDPIPVENHIALLGGNDGDFHGSVGVLRDISDRQRRERRLTVLNRALRHDLRNSMHVILANAELIERTVSDPEIETKLQTIQRRAEEINGLSEKAREIEQTIGERTLPRKRIDLASLLAAQTARFREQYPDATIETEIPEHAWVEAIELVDVAVENLIENSLEHTENQTVEVRVDVAPDTVTVTVADDGPGIPAKERRVVNQGSETPLDHASGLGLWLVAWITRDSGGDVVFGDGDDTVVRLVLDRATTDADRESSELDTRAE